MNVMKHVLYLSQRSPFARRVRIVLDELHLPYETVSVDVFNPPHDYFGVNPLGRVPVLKTPSEETIIDSNQIIAYIQSRFTFHSLFLFGGESEARARSLSGVALGIMEQVVALVVMRTMGGVVTSTDLREDYRASIEKGLEFLDSDFSRWTALAGSQPKRYALGSELRMCDIDLGVALAYVELRLGAEALDRYPFLRKYLDFLNERESFTKSVPSRS